MAVRLIDRDVLFLHVPKTGGHFVRYALQRLGIPHAEPPAIGGECPLHGTVRNYAKARMVVACVRHPTDWIESWWRFHAGGIWDHSAFPYFIPYASEIVPVHKSTGDDFSALVSGLLDECPGVVSRLFRLYADDADAVMRTETLEEDLAEIIGVDPNRLAQMAYQNVSRPMRVAAWPAGLRDAWEAAEADAIKRWYQ